LFTYKFLGLDRADATTPYYYGSVPGKPELGQLVVYNQTGNRYVVVRIVGEGLVDDGDGTDNQQELAWADIARGETVPTLWLQKIIGNETEPKGGSVDFETVKRSSQINRTTRFSKPSGRTKTMFYIKGTGGYLCSTDRLVMNQEKSINANALKYATKAEAEAALARALKNFGNIPNQLKVVEE
jgi:hypothetical protein